jgi:hypothetical protein
MQDRGNENFQGAGDFLWGRRLFVGPETFYGAGDYLWGRRLCVGPETLWGRRLCVGPETLCGAGDFVWGWRLFVGVETFCGGGDFLWGWRLCGAGDFVGPETFYGAGDFMWGWIFNIKLYTYIQYDFSTFIIFYIHRINSQNKFTQSCFQNFSSFPIGKIHYREKPHLHIVVI